MTTYTSNPSGQTKTNTMVTNTHRYTRKNCQKDVPLNPNDPRLTLQDLEEMNKQPLAELEVSSSSSDSSLHSPTQDPDDLQDHPEDWLILDNSQKRGGVIFPPKTIIIFYKLTPT